MTLNPSIQRTSTSKLGHASHLKRFASKMRATVFLLTFALSASAVCANDRVIRAMARDTGYSEQQIRLERKKGCDGGVSGDMAICAQYSFYEAEVTMNDVFRKLTDRLEEPYSKGELQAAQHSWISFRDAQCRFDTTAWTGGSFRIVAKSSCRELITRDRTKTLLGYLNCKSEDCPPLRQQTSK
jgi:uncharacterized protein YecT (DUF1311 family)